MLFRGETLKDDHPRYALAMYVVRRYEEVLSFPPQDYLNNTSQWELDLMWLARVARNQAERELHHEAIEKAKGG